jgi:transcriptional regulator with XRE-family HTH domain
MSPKIEPFYGSLGKLVRERRNQLGMTQEQLGSQLNPPTTRVSIANLESGKQRILAHTLVQLATVLKLTVGELMPAESETPVADQGPDIAGELIAKLNINARAARKILKKTEDS